MDGQWPPAEAALHTIPAPPPACWRRMSRLLRNKVSQRHLLPVERNEWHIEINKKT